MIENIDDILVCSKHGAYAKSQVVCPRCGKKPTEAPKNGGTQFLATMPSVLVSKTEKVPFLSYSAYITKYTKSSKTEYDRYCTLWSLADSGIIQDFECQPKFELRPRIIVKKTELFPKPYTQAREIYTADFRYTIQGYTIIEDVKGAKIKGKTRQLKPYVKTAARNKHKSLIAIWYQQGRLHNTRLLLTVWYNKQWHYFNSNQNEIQFSLESIASEAA